MINYISVFKMIGHFLTTLLCVKLSLQSMCTDLSNLPQVNTSHRVDGSAINESLAGGLLSCVENCRETESCEVFNYNLETTLCSLYPGYNISLTSSSDPVVSSRRKDWVKDVEALDERTSARGYEVRDQDSTTHEDVGCYTMVRNHAHYTGKVNVTENGNPCQRWDKQVPQEHDYGSEVWHFVKIARLVEVANYCRSPSNYKDGRLWCYTTVPGIRWEHCDIPPCVLTLPEKKTRGDFERNWFQ